MNELLLCDKFILSDRSNTEVTERQRKRVETCMRYNRGRDGAMIVFAEEEWSVVHCVCLCVFAYLCKRERVIIHVC